MPKTTIIFVRHADVHNPENVMYGRLPRFRLSDQGLNDAEATARALAEEPLAAIFSSPLLRAKQTARIIAQHHPDARLYESRLLLEIKTHFQGRPWPTFPRHPNYYDAGAGDETVVDVFQRMQRIMFRILQEYPGKSVVCVSHGDPIKIIRLGYLGRPLTADSAREPDPAKGCILRFVWEDPSMAPEITYFEPSTGRHMVGYWERVGQQEEIPPGTMKAVTVEGAPVLVANVDGEFFAMADRCGHMNALLHRGKLEGKCITCPLHLAQYDVETGKVLREAQVNTPLTSQLDGSDLQNPPTLPRRTYDVQINDNSVYVRIR